MSNIYIFIAKQVHLLDLSGVVQVFQETQQLGFNYDLQFISNTETNNSSAGLELSSLVHFSKVNPEENDLIFIPGFDTTELVDQSDESLFYDWLRTASAKKTTICSICTGAFILAKAGILDHRECTTHWRYIEQLKREFPLLRTLDDRLFVKSQNIYTSAGVTTGIDLALFLIEERHGELVALKIARELAVYIRRDAKDNQESVFLQFRNHHDQKIHTVQDWLIDNLDKSSTIESLATLIHTSPRNLTRIFRKQTGITLSEYRTKLRIEKAKKLQQHSGYKAAYIAQLCGFKSSKQLRAILKGA